MALINCNGCGNIVSDKAYKCPKCGCPIEKKVYVPEEKTVVVDQQPKKESSGYKVLKIVLILLLLVFVGYVGYKTFVELKKRENAKLENRYEIQAEVQAEREREENSEKERFEELKKITPDLFFYDKSKGGQFRQDLVQNLRKMGFESDDDKTFTLFSSDKVALASVSLISYNKEYRYLEENTQNVSIDILYDQFKQSFIDYFKEEIEKRGFVYTEKTTSVSLSRPTRPNNSLTVSGDLYMRISKEINRRKYSLDHYLAQWDAVEFYSSSIACMSKDEIKEDDLNKYNSLIDIPDY